MSKKERSSHLNVERVEQKFRQVDPPENLNSGVILVEGSMVDVNYERRLLTGVVLKKMEEERYLVFIDDLLNIFELERKYFRVRGEVKELGKSLFSSGTLVEVRHGLGNDEISWLPAMIVKKCVESGKKKVIFKFCNKVFRFSDGTTKKKTTEFYRFRPTPPPLEVDGYNLLDCVEMFYGSGWRRGTVITVLADKCYVVSLKATNENLTVKHMDIRPFMKWEDGVWHNGSVPLELEDSIDGCGKRKREETDNLGLNETRGSPCNGSKVCDKGKSICFYDDVVDVDDQSLSTGLTSYQSPYVVNSFDAGVEETPARAVAASPFAKMSPAWKMFEANELYNRVLQTPHFSPLFDANEDTREMTALGLMMTFCTLLDEVKSLKLDVSSDKLNSLSSSFANLEKYGFNGAKPQSVICKVLFLQAERAKKQDKRKYIEGKMEVNKKIRQNVEEEMAKLELKSMELKRQELVAKENKDAVEKRVVEMKSCAGTINQEIKELELAFHTTVSAAWK